MKKIISMLLSATMILALLSGCSSSSDEETTSSGTSSSGSTSSTTVVTGEGNGYGGSITVEVTLEGDKIVDVTVDAPYETAGISDPAITGIPEAMIASGSADVDVVSGATWTSNGIIYAVNNAIDPTAFPYPVVKEETAGAALASAEATLGLGVSSLGRTGTNYSFNQIFAGVLFDADGKILAIEVDQLEVTSGISTTPRFGAYPGTSSIVEDDPITVYTDEDYLAQFETWVTKRDRGDSYVMTSASWADEMDRYQEEFIGLTVEEVVEWFNMYCSDTNGRALKVPTDDTSEEDRTKFEALSAEEQAMLADVTTTATMSLDDGHGSIIEAIVNAYDNRVAVESCEVSNIGLGASFLGRIGPGTDDTGVGVYGFNNIYTVVLLNDANEIVGINIDQVEVSTPNYDGADMPHFGGFPGSSYNNDADHDEIVDGVIEYDEDTFLAEVAGWVTKTERGDSYKMGIGTWADQIAKYQSMFVGMTADEIAEWFALYTNDSNGRPMQEGSSDETDAAKYDALSDEEKAMLVDVTSSATMSLNDGHGDIIASITKATNSTSPVDITIG